MPMFRAPPNKQFIEAEIILGEVMKNKELDNILDQVTAGIRAEQVDEAVVGDATERVWAKLSTENSISAKMEAVPADRIEGCADFQTLIPAYLGGRLSQG